MTHFCYSLPLLPVSTSPCLLSLAFNRTLTHFFTSESLTFPFPFNCYLIHFHRFLSQSVPQTMFLSSIALSLFLSPSNFLLFLITSHSYSRSHFSLSLTLNLSLTFILSLILNLSLTFNLSLTLNLSHFQAPHHPISHYQSLSRFQALSLTLSLLIIFSL